ncbi:MAG: outer membrane protein transport protein [Pseudomonadota bacterium]
MTLRALATGATALSLLATTALSGGIERAAPSTRVLFEEGRYFEFSFASVSPNLSGKDGTLLSRFSGLPVDIPLEGETGNLLDNYITLGMAYKGEINDKLSYAFLVDQPYGTNTIYPSAIGGLPEPSAIYGDTEAKLTTVALTSALRYEVTPGVSLYGGLRIQRMSAEASLPFVSGYEIETDVSTGVGYMAGVAYERPDIALRVALTYYSAINHEFTADETVLVPGVGAVDFDDGEFEIDTPSSIALEFQTGVAPGTLVFGSIRRVNWSDFEIVPPNYPLGTLVAYEEDWTTYTLGVGRQLTDTLSGSISYTLEPASDTVLTSLGPVDGRRAINLGLRYKKDAMTISGGLSFIELGDAENVLGTQYEDGEAVAFGLRLGFNL